VGRALLHLQVAGKVAKTRGVVKCGVEVQIQHGAFLGKRSTIFTSAVVPSALPSGLLLSFALVNGEN
jgi:hypothetical protein